MSKKPIVPPYEKDPKITALAIDTHAHFDQFDEETSDRILSMREADGLGAIIAIATGIEPMNGLEPLIKKDKKLYFALGIHPYDIEELNDEFCEFVQKTKAKYGDRMVAYGEIGLDQYGEVPDIRKQKDGLKKQLIIADKLQLPVIFHIRNAGAEMYEFLKENKNLINHGGVVHCFSGTIEQAKFYETLGLYFSFTGAVTYKKHDEETEIDRVIKQLPHDKIMIETDCPYLSPAPYRGKQNTPKMVLVTARYLADLLQMDVNRFIEMTTKNAERCFNIKP